MSTVYLQMEKITEQNNTQASRKKLPLVISRNVLNQFFFDPIQVTIGNLMKVQSDKFRYLHAY